MKRMLRKVVDVYVLVKVAPVVIGGAIILIEASINGIDNTIELLRTNRISKEKEA